MKNKSYSRTISGWPLGPYGPINPGDNVLQISLIDRESFRQILTDAETSQLPAIIHGSYQSGKTSLLFAMSQDLARRGYEVFFVDLEQVAPHYGFTRERFYIEISLQIFNERMGEAQCRSHLAHRKRNAFVLIDEMQCMAVNSDVERTARGFCRFLDTNRVPWIAAGTSELRELAWKKQDYRPLDPGGKGLGSPFNRAQFVLMPRLTFNEVATLFGDYEKARKIKVPETIKRDAAIHLRS